MTRRGSRLRGVAKLRKHPEFLVAILGTVVAAYMISPVLKSPLQGDDIPNSLLRPSLEYFELSLAEHIGTYVRQWWSAERRLFPVAIVEGSVIFYFLSDLTAYKAFQYCVGLAALLATASLVAPIRRQPGLWLLSVVCLVASLQFRFGYDPSIGFGVMMPSVWLKVIGTVAFTRACSVDSNSLTGRLKALAAIILWIAAILQYELVVFFVPIVGLEALNKSDRMTFSRSTLGNYAASDQEAILRARRTVILIISVSSVYTVIMTTVVDKAVRSPAYQTNFAVGPLVETYAKQSSGGMPFAWWLFGIQPFQLNLVAFLIAMASLLTVGFLQTCSMSNKGAFYDFTVTKRNLILGLTLVLVSPLSAAVSVRWQGELSFGSGYIGVYFQYLGVGILLYEASSWSFRRWSDDERRRFRNLSLGAVVAFLCFTASATAANRDFVSTYATPTNEERQKVIDLLQRRDFRSATAKIQVDGEVSIVSENHSEIFFVNSSFFNHHGDKDVRYNVFLDESACGASCASGYILVRYLPERSDYDVDVVNVSVPSGR